MLLEKGYIVIKVAMQVAIPKWRLPQLPWTPTVKIHKEIYCKIFAKLEVFAPMEC